MITWNKTITKLTLVAILAANVNYTCAQGTAFGIRFTPSYVPSAAVNNPSPSNVYGRSDFDINAGIYALRYFKLSPWGVKAGFEYGAIPFLVGIDAPRNAFGTGAGGDAQINSWFRTNEFGYAGFTISSTFRLPLKDRYLEFSGGPSVRFYNYPKNGFSEIGRAFNRVTPYDPDDPSAGPPDQRVRITDLDVLYLSFPVSVDYVIRTGKRSEVKFGLMHNISQPLHGELEMQMYGKMYLGTFRPRTGFWGVNIQYQRLSKQSASTFSKRIETPRIIGRYRKAVFVETYSSPGFLLANYDMRLGKDRNDGLGITLGAGLGNVYLSDVPTNNTSPYKRRLALPFGINYVVGQETHGAEIGASIIPQIPLSNIREGNNFQGTNYTARLGYRFQPIREGFLGRVAWSPTIERNTARGHSELALLNIAVSAGYSFK